MRRSSYDSAILFFSHWVLQKLKIHGVSELDVEEAFFLHDGPYLIDTRLGNRTSPPTIWFIGRTSSGKLLKVVLKVDLKLKVAVVKTAYEPSQNEVDLYEDS